MNACVLDTDVVIAALDRGDVHHAQAVAAITTMIDDDTELLLSLVNYAETLVRPARDDETLRSAVEAVTAMGVRLIAPTPSIARDAARYRGMSISLADGFAIATAIAARAGLASFDLRVQRAQRVIGMPLAVGIA